MVPVCTAHPGQGALGIVPSRGGRRRRIGKRGFRVQVRVPGLHWQLELESCFPDTNRGETAADAAAAAARRRGNRESFHWHFRVEPE